MKTKSYLFSMLLIAFALVALPAVAADTAPGFKSADCVIGPAVDVSDVATAIAHSGKDNVLAKMSTAAESIDTCTNIKTESMLNTEIAKTGIGMLSIASLASYNRMGFSHRLPLYEVGWRTNA